MTHLPADASSLLARLVDLGVGALSDDEVAAMRRLLLCDPSFRAAYLEYTTTHAALLLEHQRPLAPLRAVEFRDPPAAVPIMALPARRRIYPWAIAAAVAFVGVAVAVYSVATDRIASGDGSTASVPIATLIWTDEAIESEELLVSGEQLRPQTIRTSNGETEFLTNSGAGILLQGPCELSLHGPNAVTLTRGAAAFDCPASAVGFTVDLPGGARIIDLGTRFDLTMDTSGVATLVVVEGSVRLEVDRTSASAREVHSGMQVIIDTRLASIRSFKPLPQVAPVAYWPLDSIGDDGTVASGLPFGLTGRLMGTWPKAAPPDTSTGTGLVFNGVDRAVRIPDGEKIILRDQPFTLTARIKPAKANAGWILYRKDRSENPKIELIIQDGALHFVLRDSTGREIAVRSPTGSIVPGRWHDIAAVRDEQHIQVMIDGEPAGRVKAHFEGHFDPTSDASWHIGAFVTHKNLRHGGYFDGRIVEVRIYDQPLTPKQLAMMEQPVSSATTSSDSHLPKEKP